MVFGNTRTLLNQYGTRSKNVDVVVLPQDSNTLVEMLDLRMSSFKTGDTGLRNEIVGILGELLRQKVIDSESYKKLMV